jgi:hypothetical protein
MLYLGIKKQRYSSPLLTTIILFVVDWRMAIAIGAKITIAIATFTISLSDRSSDCRTFG